MWMRMRLRNIACVFWKVACAFLNIAITYDFWNCACVNQTLACAFQIIACENVQFSHVKTHDFCHMWCDAHAINIFSHAKFKCCMRVASWFLKNNGRKYTKYGMRRACGIKFSHAQSSNAHANYWFGRPGIIDKNTQIRNAKRMRIFYCRMRTSKMRMWVTGLDIKYQIICQQDFLMRLAYEIKLSHPKFVNAHAKLKFRMRITGFDIIC